MYQPTSTWGGEVSVTTEALAEHVRSGGHPDDYCVLGGHDTFRAVALGPVN